MLRALREKSLDSAGSTTHLNPVDTERSHIDFSELPSALSLESIGVGVYEQRLQAANVIK